MKTFCRDAGICRAAFCSWLYDIIIIEVNQVTKYNFEYKDFSAAFVCGNCGNTVVPPGSGTVNRNHCPGCLWSRHVDLRTGDRMSVCRGMMEPVALWVKEKGEWSILHRCVKCGLIRANRISGDDCRDNLIGMALKPALNPPFPIDKVLPIKGSGRMS